MTQTEYKETLVGMVKACGEELIERAEDLVGEADLMTVFNLYISFPTDGRIFTGVPTIEVTREYQSEKAIKVLVDSL